MESPSIHIGDVYGIYENTWTYIELPNAICIINDKKATFESTIQALNHEYLHYIITKILSKETSFKTNYGLDTLIFVKHRLKPDLEAI